MVGTRATLVMASRSSAAIMRAGSYFSCTYRVPPRVRVSSDTQMPKLKVICRTSRLRVSRSNLRMLSMAFSLPSQAWWQTTAPLGWPVEPEVKIMKAASASISRRGGAGRSSCVSRRSPNFLVRPASASGNFTCAGSPSTMNLAAVLSMMPASASGALLRCTGVATQPARHAPRNVAQSRARFDTLTITGSSMPAPADARAAAMASASAESWE